MCETLNGLLSGKYDSTKQRAVLLNGDRLRNYRSYTATMRMELLLTGHLIFTDAQFFDGLYFYWLAANKKEFDAFKELMVPFEESKDGKTPLFSIAVKCRKADGDANNDKAPDLDQVAVKTYCKQFQFSSIEHDDLAKTVFELSNDYSESYLMEYNEETWQRLKGVLESDDVAGELRRTLGPEYMNKFSSRRFELAGKNGLIRDPKKSVKSLQNYIEFMEKQLQAYKGEKSSIAENWRQYAKKLKTLFDIGDYANKWGALRGDKDWRADYRLVEFLDQSCPDGSGNTYRKKMEKLLEQAEGPAGMDNNPAATRYFARIRDELNRNIGNRSKITTSLDELERLNRWDDDTEEPRDPMKQKQASACFEEFRQLMNDRYNKALAEQHGCQFLDLCDYPKVLEEIYNQIEIQNIDIADILRRLVNNLANMSWEDFIQQLQSYQNALKASFDKWMSAYKNFPTCSIQHIATCLEEYLTLLASKITDVASKGDAAPVSTGSWDEAGTCDNDIRTILSEAYRYPCYFIGGGSFEASPEGNEICILCVGDTCMQENMAVLRLRFDEKTTDDRSFDTLLAPVCNPLNGGALEENGR